MMRCLSQCGVQHMDTGTAVAQHLGIEALHRPIDHCEQATAVVVAVEDRLAPVAARGDVVGRAGKLDAQRAGHAHIVRRGQAKGKT